MSLTDDSIRQALAARAVQARGRSTVADPPLGRIAHAIALSDPYRRTVESRQRPSLLLAAAVAVVAVGVVVAFSVIRPTPSVPGLSSSSSAAQSVAAGTPQTSSTQPSLAASPSIVIKGCDALGFSAIRCRAIVTRAEKAMIPPVTDEDVVVATVMAPAPNGVSLGSFDVADVRLDLVNESANIPIRCLFLSSDSDRACNDDAKIIVNGGVSHDVPCGPNPCGEGNPGSTPPPTPKPAVVAASTPLILRTLDVTLDHVGHYEVLAGVAWLPDGLLSERSGELADPRPTTWWIDSGIAIDVRPVGPCPGGCPVRIDSIYHPPFRGPAQVRVYLVFDVVELNQPGAILEIRNLVVR